MSRLDKALSQANKVMASSPATKGETPRARSSLSLSLVAAMIIIAGFACAYFFLTKISESKAASKAAAKAAAKQAEKPFSPSPSQQPAKLPPRPIEPDPGLQFQLQQITLSAILANPARVQVNGKIIALGQELIPGLTLKHVEKNALIAEDAAGAVYRQTF
ncbi:MAG TPA: hypothetical protein PLN52_04095 [Opitutaceae bacterium]|nr:hypothetical protein [Opitutaceae bacterium]